MIFPSTNPVIQPWGIPESRIEVGSGTDVHDHLMEWAESHELWGSVCAESLHDCTVKKQHAWEFSPWRFKIIIGPIQILRNYMWFAQSKTEKYDNLAKEHFICWPIQLQTTSDLSNKMWIYAATTSNKKQTCPLKRTHMRWMAAKRY